LKQKVEVGMEMELERKIKATILLEKRRKPTKLWD